LGGGGGGGGIERGRNSVAVLVTFLTHKILPKFCLKLWRNFANILSPS